MIVTVRSGQPVELVDPATFTAFHVESDITDPAAVLAALGADGRPGPEGHVLVRADAVRRWAGDAADAAWEDGFAGMLAFAESKGWLDDGFIAAHIESAGA